MSESTATLRLEGRAPVTLREGQSVAGIEVQLITPRAVYLRYNGDVFMVDTRR
jgi:hypothetical protein